MKKIMMIVAASFLGAGSAMAASDHAQIGHDEKCIKECQMLVRNCAQEVDSIQGRISKLNTEIAKGTSVYTVEELRILKRKLDDAQATFGHLTMGG